MASIIWLKDKDKLAKHYSWASPLDDQLANVHDIIGYLGLFTYIPTFEVYIIFTVLEINCGKENSKCTYLDASLMPTPRHN